MQETAYMQRKDSPDVRPFSPTPAQRVAELEHELAELKRTVRVLERERTALLMEKDRLLR